MLVSICGFGLSRSFVVVRYFEPLVKLRALDFVSYIAGPTLIKSSTYLSELIFCLVMFV